jgi:hypothetical protein
MLDWPVSSFAASGVDSAAIHHNEAVLIVTDQKS